MLLGALSSFALAQQVLTAQQVIEKALVAMGGEQHLAAIHTATAEGKVELLGGFPGTYQLWAKAPNKLKTVWDIRYIQQERAFDGVRGWEKNASVRELVGRDLSHLRHAAVFDPLLTFVNEGAPATLKPMETIPANQLPFHASYRVDSTAPMTAQPPEEQQKGRKAYVVELTPAGEEGTTFYFDAETFLPLRESYQEPYEEGLLPVDINYGDYRKVDDVMLPFAITDAVPDLPLMIHVDEYHLNLPIPDAVFQNPLGAHASDAYEVTLDTIPHNVYKENDGIWGTGWTRAWGIPFVPTESWLFNLVVNEKYGRYLEPVAATLEFFSGTTLERTVTYSQDALQAIQKFPATRFSPQPEIFDLRYQGTEPISPAIDRLVCKLQLRAPNGGRISRSREIPLTHYAQKTKLIFPIKGKCIVTDGHEFYELAHKYEWSQHYAYDIVGLGQNFELKNKEGRVSENFVTYASREILAPADGTVVYARNDVPDDMSSIDYLRNMPDPIYAIGGNVIVIDHGNGEYSLLAHNHQGSVRVKAGDKVRQGQVIALMGSSGSPGAPHVHYQLQAGPGLFSSDGLPSQFENVMWTGWGIGDEPLRMPKRGLYLIAK